ncbi:hypothetical protein FRC00_001110 [Tulasnella sp. 408]|nr:hypothetical protein FRC00_001110 [Tulasnella sp. 408]
MDAGPSQLSTPARTNGQANDVDLKQRVVRVVMEGVFWEAEDVFRTTIPGEEKYVCPRLGVLRGPITFLSIWASREIMTIVPDSVDGPTHTFFLVFPAPNMAQAYMAEWKGRADWVYGLVTDEDLDVYLTCAESLTMAAQRGPQVPKAAVRMPCTTGGSSIPGSTSQSHGQEGGEFFLTLRASSRNVTDIDPLPHLLLLNSDSAHSDPRDEPDSTRSQSAATASATLGSLSTSPPSKKRRLSEGGSAISTKPAPAHPPLSASEIRDAMRKLCQDLLLEWVPGQRTGKPSVKALGKRPEK